MKRLLLVVLSLCSLLTHAGRYQMKEDTKDYVTFTDTKWDIEHVFIKDMQADLFQRFYIKDTKGPKWQGLAEDFLEKEHDFHEWSSYWHERAGDDCWDTVGSSDDVTGESWELRWKAVKRLKGSKKSVFYIVEFVTLVEGKNGICELFDAEYVFLNKVKDGRPVYLGEPVSKLPKF